MAGLVGGEMLRNIAQTESPVNLRGGETLAFPGVPETLQFAAATLIFAFHADTSRL